MNRFADVITMRGRILTSPGEATRALRLYGADTPNTWKCATMLEELDLEYDVIVVDIMSDQQKTPEYLEKNPNGRTPTLVDHSDQKPFAVFESGAIMLYLAEKHPSPLLPPDERLKSEVTQWLFWQVSALGPMFGQCMYMKRIASGGAGVELDRLQFSIDRFERECYRLYDILETRLAEGREYLCGSGPRGSYTVADIACWGYACQHWWAGLDISQRPNVRAWLDRVGRRPAIQTGFNVPGRSVLGSGAPTFAKLFSDTSLQSKMVESAAARGAPHFGWKDYAALKVGSDGGDGTADGKVAFASHVPSSSSASKSSSDSHRISDLVLAAAAGAVLARLFGRYFA